MDNVTWSTLVSACCWCGECLLVESAGQVVLTRCLYLGVGRNSQDPLYNK